MLCACAVFYCHLRPIWLCHIFPHYVTKQHEFRGGGSHWSVFWFSLQLLSQTFLILRAIRRDTVINVHSFSCKIPVILVRCYSNFKLLDRFSKKSANIKFRTGMRPKTQSIPAQNVTSLSKNPLTGHFIHPDYKLKSGQRRYTKTQKVSYSYTLDALRLQSL